jgi:hypothetical protein
VSSITAEEAWAEQTDDRVEKECVRVTVPVVVEKVADIVTGRLGEGLLIVESGELDEQLELPRLVQFDALKFAKRPVKDPRGVALQFFDRRHRRIVVTISNPQYSPSQQLAYHCPIGLPKSARAGPIPFRIPLITGHIHLPIE